MAVTSEQARFFRSMTLSEFLATWRCWRRQGIAGAMRFLMGAASCLDRPESAPDDAATAEQPCATSRPHAMNKDRATTRTASSSPDPHVLIVGAGFGGLAAARGLARRRFRVTLVDRTNHHCFQPLLYQVATAALEPADISYPIRAIFARHPRVQVLLDEVDAVDLAIRQVHGRAHGPMAYDYLILACGSTISYFGKDQWRAHAPGLKTIEDALAIRRRVLSAFEAAEHCREAHERAAWLTFVVIGGGPTGVEMAGAIAEMARVTIDDDFRCIDPEQATVLLLQGDEALLDGYPAGLQQAAVDQLGELGVVVELGQRVTDIGDGQLAIGERRIRSQTIIWAAGVGSRPISQRLGLSHERDGRVPVGADLSLEDHPEVFVIGDLAAARSQGAAVPGVAPAAIQGGQHVVRCLSADQRGRSRPDFVYRNRGSMATIGRNRAVAHVASLSLRGWLAWLTWGLVHIAMLIGFRSRVVVMVNWIWNWLTCRRGARIIIGRPRYLAKERDQQD